MKVEVKTGQLWQDMDKRMNGRTVYVQSIVKGSRYRGGYTIDDPKAVLRDAGGKETKVAVRRMETGKRWRLVRDEHGVRVPVIDLMAELKKSLAE